MSNLLVTNFCIVISYFNFSLYGVNRQLRKKRNYKTASTRKSARMSAIYGVCQKPKSSYLRIQGEGIEPHWANESNVSGLGVENVIICGDPQTSMFGQDLHHLKIERTI